MFHPVPKFTNLLYRLCLAMAASAMAAPAFAIGLLERTLVELAAPNKDPVVTGWDYSFLYSSGATQNVDEVLDEVYQHIVDNNDPAGCGVLYPAPVSGWQEGPKDLGITIREERLYKTGYVVHGNFDSEPGLECDPSGDYQESTFPVNRRRDVLCPWEGYVQNEPALACVNNETDIVWGRPLAKSCQVGTNTRFGNPCDARTGNKSLSQVDYESPVLPFQRNYNSIHLNNDARIGIGWSHNYSRRLGFMNNKPAVYVDSRGIEVRLVEQRTNVFLSVAGSGIQARASGSDWLVYKPNGARERYDSRGRLTTLISPGDAETLLSYGNDVLKTVTGPFGHQLIFHYDSLNQVITSISTPAGDAIDYAYDPLWGNLKSVTYQDNTTRTYHYEETDPGFQNHLTGITDENHDRYTTYGYDDEGRVAYSERAGGVGRVDLVYNSSATQVTDAADNTTHLNFSGAGSTGMAWSVDVEQIYLDTKEDAIARARAKSPEQGTQYLEVSDESTVAMDNRIIRRNLADVSLDGGTRSFVPRSADYADRLDQITDENGVTTRFNYSTYHLKSVTENYGSQQTRSRYYSYLEDTSTLPRTVLLDGVSDSASNRKKFDIQYSPGTRLPHVVKESGFTPDGDAVPDRVTTFSAYDDFGRPETIDGPRTDVADTITFAYYDKDESGQDCSISGGGRCGRLQSITNALGHTSRFDEYFADGRIRRTTDPNGLATEYTYTARGWVDTITETAGAITRVTDFDYDDAGQVERVILPNGVTLNYRWTAAHLLDYITDNNANRIDYSYDGRGNQTGESLINANGLIRKSVTKAFDARNRLKTLQHGSNMAATFEFDALGNLNFATDPEGVSTDYDPDVFNRLESITDALNPTDTTFDYDPHDRLTSVAAPNGATTTYKYDDLGNLLEEVSPDRGRTLYAYDAAGNMTCKADGRYSAGFSVCDSNVQGRWDYSYDALNRIKTIDFTSTAASPDIAFEYDAANELGRLNLVSYEEEAGAMVDTQYDYDLFGNVTEKRQYVPGSPVSPAPYTTSYTHDSLDQPESITYPSGRVIDYGRNVLGQITSVTMTSPVDQSVTTLVTNVRHEPFGPSTHFYFDNGLISMRVLDDAYRVGWTLLGNNGRAWDLHEYSRDQAGNVLADIDYLDGTNTRDYDYDLLYRLTGDSHVETDPSLTTYAYDANGNRLEMNATEAGFYNQDFDITAPNRISRLNGQTLAFDGAGNLTTAGLGRTLTYNAANRLRRISTGGNRITTLYNGVGELARTFTSPNCPCGGCARWTEYFHFDSQGRALSLVQESSGGFRIVWDWVWVDDRPVAQIQESFAANGSHAGTEITWLHTDHLGTPRIGTDESGNITWRYESDAFGRATLFGTSTVRLRMPGQIDYGFGGLYYNYFRTYDSRTGRYLESDPLGLQGGLNTYGYAYQNPLSYVDPYGLEVLHQAHPVALGMDHSKVTIIPDNQVRYANDPRFNNITEDGRRYATLGAGPEDGNLVSNPNRERDLNLDHNVYSEECTLPDDLDNEDEFIDRLFELDRRYRDNIDYEFFPNRWSDGNNSNSYVNGLLRATGVEMPAPPTSPGYDKPVPAEAFE